MEIILTIFLVSIAITFLVLYLIGPKPKIIIKYPNVDEKLSRLYVDDNNVCYRYKTKKVACKN